MLEKNGKMFRILLAVLNVIMYVVMLTMNALAVLLPLNGKSTGELSDSYPNLFVPAGLTFSIWSVIYTLLLIFVISQVIAAIKGSNKQVAKETALVVALNFAFNALWIITWHYELMFLSLLVMLGLLGTLIFLFLKTNSMAKDPLTTFLVKLPINVYLGWISVATIANVTAFLVTLNWNGFGIAPSLWTILVLLVGGALGSVMLLQHKVISYALVVIWAFAGIIIKRGAQSVVEQGIIICAYVVIAVLTLLIIFTLVKKLRKTS